MFILYWLNVFYCCLYSTNIRVSDDSKFFLTWSVKEEHNMYIVQLFPGNHPLYSYVPN